MELRHLRYFVAVAKELHFGNAARNLNISQPPLTLQIKNLEEELGVELLVRTKRKVSLTKAGETFLKRAESILHASERAANEARKISQGGLDTLVIGFMGAVMLGEFPPFLLKFRRAYPSVELKFQQMRSDEQYEALVDGRIDCGFVDLGVQSMIDQVHADAIEFDLILREPLLAAVPKDHPLANRTELSIADLAGENFVALQRYIYPSHYDKLVSRCEQAGFSPNIVAMSDQTSILLTYVASGVGVYLAPECTRNAWHRYISFIPLEEKVLVDVHLITRKDDPSVSLCHLREIAVSVQSKMINQANKV